MPSVHKQPGRPFYFCAYTTPDGVRRFVTTKQTNKQAAEVACHEMEAAAIAAENKKLDPEKARDHIQRSVDRIRDVITLQVSKNYKIASGEVLPLTTIKNWCQRWMASKEVAVKEKSAKRYQAEIDRFLKLLGKDANKDLSLLEHVTVLELRDKVAGKLSAATANMFLKTLRVCLNDAVTSKLISSNPAASIKRLSFSRKNKKRPFTKEELGKILKASKNTEWYGMILTSLYSGGARLGDCASLICSNVDLEKGSVTFTPSKTEHTTENIQELPLHPALKKFLAKCMKGKMPNDPLFPECFETAQKATSTLSNRFFDKILVKAGIATKRQHSANKKGRDAAREGNAVSFHSLRHSATSLLKEKGVSDSLAMEIVGHETTAINQAYTTIEFSVKKDALEKMPDVTKSKA